MTIPVGQFKGKRIDAAMAVHEEFRCNHVKTELRSRVIKGGAVQYLQQCLRCGDGVGGAQRQDLVRSIPPPWDANLKEKFNEDKQIALVVAESEFDGNFWESYNAYLRSPEWATRRRLVMERAQGLCEGCRLQRAAQVHHLTYAHVGAEFLFELVAICKGCHDRIHPEGHE